MARQEGEDSPREPALVRSLRRLRGKVIAPERFVFIVTYGRSGSTVLQHVIGSIPGYQINGENGDALYGLYKSYAAVVQAKKRHGKGQRALSDPWYGADRMTPRVYGKRLAEAFVAAVLVPKAGVRVLGFKEIRYVHRLDDLDGYLDFLVDFFPDARLIFNVRAPADVAKSAWWQAHTLDDVAAHIAGFNRAAEACAARHPDACLTVDYDRYSADPEALRELFGFLGEPFDLDAVKATLAVRTGNSLRSGLSERSAADAE